MINFWIIFFSALGGFALGVFGVLLYFCLTMEQEESTESEWWDDS